MNKKKTKSCQALTSDGEKCENPAIFPKDNPIACHIEAHQKQMMEKLKLQDKENNNINEKETLQKNKKVIEAHIFASNRLTHTIFVRYPEDDEREYFRAQFRGGKFETSDNEKAELLKETIKKFGLENIVKKIQ